MDLCVCMCLCVRRFDRWIINGMYVHIQNVVRCEASLFAEMRNYHQVLIANLFAGEGRGEFSFLRSVYAPASMLGQIRRLDRNSKKIRC